MPDNRYSDVDIITTLLRIIKQLRDPDSGCPWDIQQTFESISPFTLEEAYEVADAIQNQDMQHLKEELGDLLFQVVFHSRIAEELGEFNFYDVVEGVSEKMIRRHPHVFSCQSPKITIDELAELWELQKSQERKKNDLIHGPSKKNESELDGVIKALPALVRAEKLQKRAARVGFDWESIAAIVEKINEELGELEAEIDVMSLDGMFDEIGDLLFTCVNLSRHLKIDPEAALRHGNNKFEKRFRAVEKSLRKQGKRPESSSLYEMTQIWDAIKHSV